MASHPPSTGPTATMPPMVAPQTANAMPRSLPWKFAFTSESVVGSTIAPPKPWTTLAAIISPADSVEPAQTEATIKMKIPIKRSRLRPILSASEPHTKRVDANTST